MVKEGLATSSSLATVFLRQSMYTSVYCSIFEYTNIQKDHSQKAPFLLKPIKYVQAQEHERAKISSVQTIQSHVCHCTWLYGSGRLGSFLGS